MAVAASGTFWIVLREHAKLVGHVQGDATLPKTQPDLWRTNDTRLAEIMGGFTAQLQNLWSRYPDWKDEEADELTGTWQNLALHHGYKFTFGSEGDALHFV